MMKYPLFIKDQVLSSDPLIVQMMEHPQFIKDQVTSSDSSDNEDYLFIEDQSLKLKNARILSSRLKVL